ncbi:MAG: septation ring formation regulator EzrA [Catenisphaera adipataccumulans]|jgi:septation ring formation regulator|uniref:septation ring formation regulator EzrA n=1 Tax=Catenisphaera adipataccumulans TaxID=700500 RepID=UPI003D8A756F
MGFGQDVIYIYICIAVLVLILVLILTGRIHQKKAAERMEELKKDIDELSSNSLEYKYNKASAFSKSNTDIMDKVNEITPQYKKCFEGIEACKKEQADTEAQLKHGKYKKNMEAMDHLEVSVQETDERIRLVGKTLDRILEKETKTREFANALKERFRNVKTVYTDNRMSFYTSKIYFDSRLQEIENDFSGFEEWMNASEFDKAREEGEKIAHEVDILSSQIAACPGLYEKAKAIIPQAMTEVMEHVEESEADGINFDYINVENRLNENKEALDLAIKKLDAGSIAAANDDLNEIADEVLKLQDEIAKEQNAVKEINEGFSSDIETIKETETELQEIKTLYAGIKDRFGLEDWSQRFTLSDEQIVDLKEAADLINNQLKKKDLPRVDIINYYHEFHEDTQGFRQQIQEMKQRLVGASSDEERAKKQLVKLELILNEVRLNAATHQLPNVSSQFEKDIKQGERLIQRVQVVLSHSPLDVKSLNADLQDAIDFVYKLYNNAKNLIGVAVMVENAIVFGNRFRSSYPSMDSDLTRAELCFQNGEYTRALKIAIQAIENVHPGVYEKLIARKDPAVMNQD